MSGTRTRTISIESLARVEGEGSLYVRTEGATVSELRLRIFEPPRFFEALLRERHYTEAPDFTARICGICPVAYQMSAVHAMEAALGIKVGGALRELRRLLHCGEWIESHTLHVYMLHAPDFLGYDDAIRMAKDHPGVLERGLAIKKAGNAIGRLLGGREIHPINVRIGGFHKTPRKRDLAPLYAELQRALDMAFETVRWVKGFPFPEFERDYEFVALRHASEYPFSEGRIVSSRGLDIAVSEYERHFEEQQVEHSNALHSRMTSRVADGEHGHYLVGPLARFNLNVDRLSPIAKQATDEAGLRPTCKNPFKSILARAVETVYACEEALRIIDAYEQPEAPFVAHAPRGSVGHGCTEAPRGILYHRYAIDAAGLITEAKIVPPTSQNQPTIEDDLRDLVPRHLSLTDADLQWKCEQAIRNYDPCISCATHFLRLDVERR
jgi:sulfhydrogenase subunit alpha